MPSKIMFMPSFPDLPFSTVLSEVHGNAVRVKRNFIHRHINMPKMNGFEVLKKLKSDAQTDFIPVIMLTSSKNEQDVLKSFKEGAASYIQKPVTYEEFVQVVNVFNFYWHIINKLPDGKRSR